jgi:ABC-type multidrug transport system fused ATPase/permease subunit
MYYTEYEKNTSSEIDKRTMNDKPLEEESASEVQKEIMLTMKLLVDIYKNKSSEEYQMMGDITKSKVYDKIESQIIDLKTLKNFPKNEANDYQRMFDNLHKPMYKKLVAEFVQSPNEKNTTFTALFTAGYRVLIGDLSKIYASTEATENGIVYIPEKVQGTNPRSKAFIHDFTKNLDEEYNKVVRMQGARPKMHQEAAFLSALGSATTALSAFINSRELLPITSFFNDVIGGIFGHRKELNPVAYMNDRLTQRYDDHIKKFEDIQKLYSATKEAYEEYKSQPGRKSFSTEGRYLKNMKKYQLQMLRAKAQIDHFDARGSAARKEAKDRLRMEKMQQRKAEREARKAAKKAAKGQKDTTPKPSPFHKPKPQEPAPTNAPTNTNTNTQTTSTNTNTDKPKPPAPVDTGGLDF